jgi:hypothetical protein
MRLSKAGCTFIPTPALLPPRLTLPTIRSPPPAGSRMATFIVYFIIALFIFGSAIYIWAMNKQWHQK